jgi:hypothetical protein
MTKKSKISSLWKNVPFVSNNSRRRFCSGSSEWMVVEPADVDSFVERNESMSQNIDHM